ncbi:MAG TPA: biotin transporter BioY, partial [Coriobacteriia bacterium]
AFPIAAGLGSLAYRALRRAPGATGIVAAPVVAALVIEAVVYALGVPWLIWTTHMPPGNAVAVAMLPFLVPDAAKATVAVVIATAVRRALAEG